MLYLRHDLNLQGLWLLAHNPDEMGAVNLPSKMDKRLGRAHSLLRIDKLLSVAGESKASAFFVSAAAGELLRLL